MLPVNVVIFYLSLKILLLELWIFRVLSPSENSPFGTLNISRFISASNSLWDFAFFVFYHRLRFLLWYFKFFRVLSSSEIPPFGTLSFCTPYPCLKFLSLGLWIFHVLFLSGISPLGLWIFRVSVSKKNPFWETPGYVLKSGGRGTSFGGGLL